MSILRPLSFVGWLWSSAALCAQAPQQIGIGTWNLEFFGAEPTLRNDTPPRTDDDVMALGTKIRELGVAVLAVQEICGEKPLQQLVKGMGPNWSYVLGTTGSWDDGKTQQGIGFVFDQSAVELLSAEELLDFPRDIGGVAVFHRKPVTACFRHRATGCDFRLVTVHLKAGQKAADEEKRRLEASTLRAWLDALAARAGEDHDVAVLGDFNSAPGAEPETLLEQGHALDDLLPHKRAASILHFDAQIDHIFAAKGFAELGRSTAVVHAVDGDEARRAYRKTYSDHFPVTATITARSDDDPDATFTLGVASQRLPLSVRVADAAATAHAAQPGVSWPPPVGAAVVVRTAAEILRGSLAQPLPQGPGGWVVLNGEGGRLVAIPLGSVQTLRME